MKIRNIWMLSPLPRGWSLLVVLLVGGAIEAADDKDTPRTVRYQVTGLFAKEREADLREAIQKIPLVRLVSIDFANACATFEYTPAKAFPGARPEQIVQRFDDRVRSVSNSTFGIRSPRTIPRDKLAFVEIPVAGCVCKACSLAAYEAIFRLEGVEQATASFREGRVTALIDPKKIDRTRLETALKKRGVDVRSR